MAISEVIDLLGLVVTFPSWQCASASYISTSIVIWENDNYTNILEVMESYM